jgi:hypothetical protein
MPLLPSWPPRVQARKNLPDGQTPNQPKGGAENVPGGARLNDLGAFRCLRSMKINSNATRQVLYIYIPDSLRTN